MKRVSLILLLFCGIETHAQISLLKDVNSLSSTNGSAPDFMVSIGSTMYFVADDGVHGRELWKKDANGVSIVKDIYVGSGSSAPHDIVVIGTTLYFRAASVEGGSELWKSDGAANGTVQVKDIFPGVTGSEGNAVYTTFLTNVNGVLFFAANDGTNGLELWKSDGTQNGTVMVKDINPSGNGVSFVIDYWATTPFVNVNGTLFFTGNDGTNGAELWKSNGTAAGTVLVKSIHPTGNSNPSYLTAVNGTLFFTAVDAPNSNKLYKSNGTSAGTIPLVTIPNIPSSVNAVNFINGNGTLYFDLNDAVNGSELWKSDGTVVGTVRVKDIYAGANSSFPMDFVWYNNQIHFAATDATGTELWKSDGTTNGTVKVKDINPTGSSQIRNLTVSGGLIYFGATEGINGFELWKSNGTASGTVLAMDINPAGNSLSAGAKYIPMADVNGQFYFAADDGAGTELWQSNGTTVSIVVDLLSGSNDSAPDNFTNVNSTVFFSANDGINGRELWKSNGTTAGTILVKNINATGDSNPSLFTEMNGSLYFWASDGTVDGLWKSDGTSAGTVLIKSDPAWYFNELINANGTLYFSVQKDDLYQIWKSNGTTAGTVMIEETDEYYSYHDLRFVNGNLYFINFANELWKTAGSVGGATLVKNLSPLDGYGGVSQITGVNNTLYFRGHDASGAGSELWKTNGTPAGTTILKDMNPAGGSYPSGFSKFGTGVVFWTAFAINDYEVGDPSALWKSDGTSAGTTLIKNVTSDNNYFSSAQLFEFGSSFYFSASGGSEGAELWKSDGTPAGTVILNDINPGGSSNPSNFVTVGGKLFFTAYDGVNREIWVTDGQSCHTQKVASFVESESADPLYLYVAGTKIYFSMNVKGYGVEPFVLDPASITFPSNTAITTQPISKTAYLTNNVSFTSVATGGNLTYQWKKGGVNINGATSSTYSINNVTAVDAGTYTVEVKGTCGTVVSSNAILTVFAADPGQPSAMTFSNLAPTSYTIKWTAPAQAPTGYLVVRNIGSSPSGGVPLDGTMYTVGNTIGNGTVAFITSAAAFDHISLTAATNYYYDVYAYNGTGTSINYAVTPLEGNRITLSLDPTAQPSGLSFSVIKETTLTLTFQSANTGPVSGYLILRKTGTNPPSFVPVDGTAYDASSSIGDATFVASGTSLSIPETGLTAGSTYAYVIYTFNGSTQSINYNTVVSGNTGSTITVPDAPTISTDPIEKNSGSFTAKWNNSPGAASYRIDVSLSTDNFTHFIPDFENRNVGNVTEVVVSGLTAATVYKFRVRAVNASGPSQNSVEKEVVTAESATTALLALSTPVVTGLKIAMNVTGGAGTRVIKFYSKKITAPTNAFVEKTLTSATDGYESTVSTTDFDELGLEYYFTARDASVSTPVETAHGYIYQTVGLNTFSAIPFSTKLNGTAGTYEMFSVPYEITDKSIASNFDELGAPDKTQWRLLRFQGGKYIEYPDNISTLDIGKGYWFNALQKVDIKTGEGKVTSANQTTPFTITFTQGWNQIGNPYPFNIDWETIKAANTAAGLNSLWLFEGGKYLKKDVLATWKGAFVFCDTGGSVSFPVSAKTTSPGRTAKEELTPTLDEAAWQLPIQLSLNELEQISAVGMHPDARASKDRFDEITIPRFIDYLEMNTYHDEFFAHHFASDMVTTTNETSWLFTVSSNQKEGVATLTWNQHALLGNQSKIALIDLQEQTLIDMKTTGNYSFTWSEGRKFKILYSREGELLPGVTMLGNAYPNPFTTGTTIPFLLEEDQTHVEVGIYDLLGRKVKTLNQSNTKAGIRSLEWNGNNEQGTTVDGGLYLYQLRGDKGILSPPKRLIKQ